VFYHVAAGYAKTKPVCTHLSCPGDKPEELYPEARQELNQMGFETTLEYVAEAAGLVMRETGLLPHINAGTMGLAEVGPMTASSCACTMNYNGCGLIVYGRVRGPISAGASWLWTCAGASAAKGVGWAGPYAGDSF
jgi:hypothetical protein